MASNFWESFFILFFISVGSNFCVFCFCSLNYVNGIKRPKFDLLREFQNDFSAVDILDTICLTARGVTDNNSIPMSQTRTVWLMTLIIEPKTSNYYKAVEKCARYKFLSRSRFLFFAVSCRAAPFSPRETASTSFTSRWPSTLNSPAIFFLSEQNSVSLHTRLNNEYAVETQKLTSAFLTHGECRLNEFRTIRGGTATARWK